MLSRLSSSAARSTRLLLSNSEWNLQSVRPVSFKVVPWKKHFENWEKAHSRYNSAERDRENFPDPVQPERHPPVRLGFIPDSWFQAFYEKTGVTGPYVFGVGALTFLLSKEYWVMDHGYVEFLSFWLAMTILIKKVGPLYKPAAEKYMDDYEKANWHEPIAKAKSEAKDVIAEAEKAIWQQDGQKMLFDAKKENVQLQLEAIYRQRLHEVQQTVKKRLDYQVEKQNAQRRFEQEHMVSWIVDNVVKSITPQQEKDSIKQCIGTLKGLAAKA